MELACDLHIHSRFSRATSKELTLSQLYLWAQRKGIGLIGTGDFTHPGWQEEMRTELLPIPDEPGLFSLRPEVQKALDAQLPRACRGAGQASDSNRDGPGVRFALTCETSHIYKKNGAVRKVHNLLMAPSLDVVERLCARFMALGCNLKADGRPILGLPCHDTLEVLLETDARACLIPAHIWTPHFSVFGSLSGFDRLEDCFGDLLPHIFALETGLSSDPAMNWRLSQLDRYTLISNSDAHSAAKLGRELNLIDIKPSYDGLRAALEHCDPSEFLGTIEFYPEEGKYHLDGHRGCEVRLEPEERAKLDGKCPRCGQPVTVGVLSRVEALADRTLEEALRNRPPRARPFTNLVPLGEVVAEVLGVGESSGAAQRLYFRLLDELGSELSILRHADAASLRRIGGELLAEAIARVRSGKLHIAPGYDGEYGRIRIFEPSERQVKRGAKDEQMGLVA
jgi:DNA helicase-2/ATP-dependent DNA helicase PcrA